MSHTRSIRRTHRTRFGVATLAVAALVAGACANDGEGAQPPPALDVELVAALQPFDACDDFLDHVKREALDAVSAYGLTGDMYFGDVATSSAGAAEDAASAPMARETDAGGDAGAAQSKTASPATTAAEMQVSADDGGTGTGTNNQETGVDEADIVKTDGSRIVTVRGNELIVVSLVAGAPYVTAKLDLGEGFSADRLFLLPDRAYVLGYDVGDAEFREIAGDDRVSSVYPGPVGGSAIVEVALGGDQPTVAHRTAIDGTIVAGRLAGGAVRLVLSTPGGTGLGFVYPTNGDERSIERAEATNRAVIEESEVADWVPSARVDGGEPAPLIECDRLYRPAEMSGFSMLSILTISDGLGSLTGTGVLADGQITYASTERLYVATNRWENADVPEGATTKRAPATTSQHTDVHSFSIAGSAPAAYEASGRVEGHVLNQYSMSESGDDLRIATTVSGNGGIVRPLPMPVDCPPNAECAVTEPAPAGDPGDSRIVVLRRDGDVLKEIGKVGGLGVTEQIKSVRYVGDIAYVVTFRQTDPFYVVDLSDPTAPKTLGELKVPGFSSYLHPVGQNLVLGVGSDATDEGRIKGAKLSLYDTSDPVAPKELATWISADLGFQADNDPHAFSWDAERSTAYLPYYGSCFSDTGQCGVQGNGVLVVRVADGAITEIGRITHDDRTPSPTPPPVESTTTTTVPETTTTTTPDETTTTVAPDETTTTVASTVPVTTVPSTVAPAKSDGESGSTGSSTGAAAPQVGASEPVPAPDVFCDPAFCDPGPIAYQPTITRVFVIGDRIITMSDVGIAAHDVNDRRLIGFAAF